MFFSGEAGIRFHLKVPAGTLLIKFSGRHTEIAMTGQLQKS